MLNFMLDPVSGNVVEITTECKRGAENRNDWRSLDAAKVVATKATAFSGKLHLAVDRGAHTSPRYDVIEAPAVGDEVSYAFNGDYYPAGKINRVSASLNRIATDAGHVFYRTGKDSGRWVRAGGTWSMVAGTHDRRNPEF